MRTRHGAAERWRRILERQRRSGMSVAAFCRRADVSPVSFYAWRRKLRAEATFVEVKVTPADCSAPVSDGIELQLPGCRRIVVRRGFDRQALVDLLQVLEHRVRNASQEAIA